jgi:hypothetical protein
MCHKSNYISYLFLIAFIPILIAIPPNGWGATAGTIETRVFAIAGDAEEVGGTVNNDIYDLELGDKLCGIRFRSINIPAGSTITNAYIQFTVDEVQSVATNLTLYTERHANPSWFVNSPNDISSRPKSAASVAWTNVPEWGTLGETGVAQQTPDLTTIVQEAIDQAAWSSGNAIVFIVEGSGRRVAKARKSGDTVAPLLHVEYVSDAVEVRVLDPNDDAEEESDGHIYLTSPDIDLSNTTDRAVGLRFQNINVPRGAHITRAYIEFVAHNEGAATLSGPCRMVIRGEAGDDAQAFYGTNGEITARTQTTQEVVWDPVPAWDLDQKYQTPDLSPIVQEIIGRAGWISGNSMVFIMPHDAGQRIAYSYDTDSAKAALLRIEYAQDNVPYIATDKTSLGASAYEGYSPLNDSLTITNLGLGLMDYTLSENSSWLSLSSSGGSLAAGNSESFTVAYDTSSLAVGTHFTTITISAAGAPNSPVELQVSVTIAPPPVSQSCGNIPIYAENLVSPAILILLDVSGSMSTLMDLTSAQANPQTPDLSPIVQEIVERQSWQSGNAMAFLIEGTGRRTAKSYDGQSGSAPLLHVEYNDGADHTLDIRVSQSEDDAEERLLEDWVHVTSADLEMVDDNGNGDQIIGVRFQNVSIPPNALITNAHIEFVIDESDSVATDLTIYGEDMDNAPAFANLDNNISGRTKTTAAVTWNTIEEWAGVTQERRIDIGKEVISELVKDRTISWGFGSWTDDSTTGYVSAIDYTKIHVGCKRHDDAHQQALQDAISPLEPLHMTPFSPSIVAAQKYFAETKADEVGDNFVDASCQPKFLITVTDGRGNTGSTVANVNTNTAALADSGVTPIGVGFGLEYSEAEQLYEMAKVANEKGEASDTDDLFALHNEDGSGVGQPFFAFNKQELIDSLNTITERIKGAIFHGSAPAPTTSVDLGDLVVVAKFDAARWIGDVEAVTKDANGKWVSTIWVASDYIPATRSIWTIDPNDANAKNVIQYTDATLVSDNFACQDTKPIGDIINSTPVVVGFPPYWYPFNQYISWAHATSRDTTVYIGANDGSLHAIDLTSGTEQWAFVPKSMQAKLNKAETDPLFDRCTTEYCHQYYVDGSPIVGDVYADFDGDSVEEWRTMLVVGEREGGEAYFALDVTSGKTFNDADPTKFLWEFTDSELGQTWGDPSIDRVAIKDSTAKAWAVYFGSGYLPLADQQANKEAYLYGILAHDAADLWKDGGGNTINRIKVAASPYTKANITNYPEDIPFIQFSVGEIIEGNDSAATATVVAIQRTSYDTAALMLDNITGIFQSGEEINGYMGGNADLDGVPQAGGGSLTNDVLASPLVVDLEGNYISDRIYVGNAYGTLYRVDKIGKGMTPEITKLFDYGNTSPNVNPIRAKADYAFGENPGDIWIYFGSGRYENQVDKQDNNQQYFFGLKDGIAPASTYSLADLVTLEAKFATVQIGAEDKTIRIIEGSNNTAEPWKMKLYDGTFDPDAPLASGTERVLMQPLVVGGVVFFTTFIPDDDICAGSGETYVMAVDYKTGAAVTEPVFDLNGDGEFDDNDMVLVNGNPVVPVGIYVGRGKGSHPVLHKDTLFITTTGDGADDVAGDDDDDDDDEDFFAKKVNVGEKKVRLESWRVD